MAVYTSLNKLVFNKSVFMFLLFGLVLVSCNVFQNPPNSFENPVCISPCWENISPGMTTKENALKILSGISEDQVIVKLDFPSGDIDSEVRFSSKDIDGAVVFTGEKVSLITLSPKSTISLQSAIKIFGEPESVLVYRGSEYTGVTFYKPKTGIAFSYTSWAQSRSLPWVQPADWLHSEIRPEAEINFITFFVPEQEKPLLDYRALSFGELSPEETLQRLYTWSGYGKIDKYLPTSQP